MILLAHLGHWYFFPLYAIPVIIVLASAVLTTVRERREKREGDKQPKA
jgi:hypothetical protein